MKYLYSFFLLVILSACGQRTETATFQIKTVESTNNNTPFYVLFKATDLPHFLTEDYKKIAHQRMLAGDDKTYLESAFFIPGETKTITVEKQPDKAIGVYFIFTHPGEEWKYLATENGSDHIKLLVSEDEIKNVSSF